jgi:hypothetical protein
LVDRQDDGVNLTRFFNKHRLFLGLSANAPKSVFGFGGGDLHGNSLGMSVLAKALATPNAW